MSISAGDRQDAETLDCNLAEIRSSSFRALLFLGAGALTVALLVLFQTHRSFTDEWLVVIPSLVGVFVGLVALSAHERVAIGLFQAGILSSIALAVAIYGLQPWAYLFVLPIIMSSALLSRWGMGLVATISLAATLSLALGWHRLRPVSATVLAPAGTILLTWIVSLVSARGLTIALAWSWSSFRHAQASEGALRDNQARLQRTLRSLHDSSERLARMAADLAAAKEQAEDARRLKAQFAATVSHELRTPINLIVGYCESMFSTQAVAGKCKLPKPYFHDLTIIHENARHLQSLINDVLDLSRVEAMQMSLWLQECHPAELVGAAMETARGLFQQKGLALRAELSDPLPTVIADETRIRQVILNLLSNAARFTDQGEVVVRAWEEDDTVMFSVADTGIGFDPAAAGRLFEEFHQLDGSTRRRHGGAGLGLTICKSFVELHGGRIWAKSTPGHGSTFYFSLPVALDGAISTGLATRRPARPDSESTASDRAEVLIWTQNRLASRLQTLGRGRRVRLVSRPEEVLAAISRGHPRGLIVDTPTDGAALQTLGAWLSETDFPDVPVIACQLPPEETPEETPGITAVIGKPFDQDTLLRTVAALPRPAMQRILLVDDEPDYAALISRQLENSGQGYRVLEAFSGEEALQLLSRRPDLVLVDEAMADMSGVEFAHRLREQGDTATPIILMRSQEARRSPPEIKGPVVIWRRRVALPELAKWLRGILE